LIKTLSRLRLRSRTLSVTALAAATVAVVVMAVTASGVPVNHVAANDGGVWLTNDNPGNGFRGTFAEFNVPVKQLGYTVGDPGTAPQTAYTLDVLQQNTTVLALDQIEGELYPIDSQTGAVSPSSGVKFPTGSQLSLGGGVAAILDPGTPTAPSRLWAYPVGSSSTPSLTGLDTSTAKPILQLPKGIALAVDDQGDVYVTSRTELVTVSFVAGAFEPPVTTRFSHALRSAEITTVGTTPVILDASAREVYFPLSGVSASLPRSLGSDSQLQLQQPGPSDPSVVIATVTSLISAPLTGQSPSVLASVPTGTPASPVRLDGCAYGAWTGSSAEAAQVCESGLRIVGPLQDSSGQPAALIKPVFRVNHNEIVLNDTADGAAWTLVGRPAQVLTHQDWEKVLVGTNPNQTNTQNPSTTTQQEQKQQPKLDNPTLDVRAGRDSTLHVLDHDTDPGGSILSIEGVSPASGPGFSAWVAPDTQTVILNVQPGVTAPITFRYTVVDGFGLIASGPVTADIVPITQERPPTPPATNLPDRSVVSGGTVKLQILGDWRDPENDPVSLSDVTVPAALGQVSWTSDGLVTFTAASVYGNTPVTITYDVTDGLSTAVPSQFGLTILGRGATNASPPTGVPDAARIVVDRSTVISPLDNDLFGADPSDPSATLTLAGPVNSTSGLSVQTNLRTGQLTLTAAQAGTYSLLYEAAYGSAVSADTQILVQAVLPAGTEQPPVTSPLSVLLHGQLASTVDVLNGDYDPAGGLLSVVGVSAPATLQATVINGEFLRIVASTSNPVQSQVVTYQVTNGRTDPVTGQVTVLWEPALPAQSPVVADVSATVRAGNEVDVPVLESASDPDGESVHLLAGGSPQAVVISQTGTGGSYPTGLGSAAVSGDYLRYSAPSGTGVLKPETVTASYIVESQDGGRTTGHAFVTVIPDSSTYTTAPEPTEVDARVTAGGTITIPIPTTGIDPDGDDVTVVGVESAPQLGQVLSYNASSVTYQAFPFTPGTGAFSGGTDDLTYQVIGPSGLTATAPLRIAVAPPSQLDPPVAIDHYVTAAPGAQVGIDLLDGDFIAPGDHVTVEPLARTNPAVPAGTTLSGLDNETLQVTAPTGAEPISIAYGLTDGTTAPSIAHVLIRSQAGYVTPPLAIDYFPSAPSPGAKSITVNVVKGDSDPGGRPGDLKVTESSAAGADVVGDDSISFPVGPNPYSAPYVIRSSTTGATAVGLVHIVGTGMGPQLKPNELIHVPENGSSTIAIGDYITEPGRQIRITTTDRTSASPSGGLSEAVKSNTEITLTGETGYVGPGSLTVQVIDAATLSAPGARTATFSIPVEVGNATPVVRCPSAPLDVVQGGAPVYVDISSVCQVWTPDESTSTSVNFTEQWKQQAAGVNLGWQSGESGHILSLVAQSGAKGGAVGTVTVGVAGGAASAASSLDVQVIEAPAPSATPVNAAPVEAGHVATIDMAQYVDSPLAQPNIDVTAVRQTSGVTTTATYSGSDVTISPQAGTPGTTLTYVATISDDGPNQPTREVNDTITLQVLGAPGPPTNIQGVPGSHEIALSWDAAADNGAPVEYYTISMGGGTPEQTSGTSYTWTGLTNGTPYTFIVTAVNQVNTGTPSSSATFTPRAVPDAPTGVAATSVNSPQGAITVTWTQADDEGNSLTGYTIFVSPDAGSAASMPAGPNATSLTWSGLDDAVGPYTFTIVAHNSIGDSPISAASTPVYAHGTPAAPVTPTATGQVSPDQSSTSVVVSWPPIANCNDAQPCASYVVSELRDGGGAPVATDTSSSACQNGELCASFGPITNDGSSYTYTLEAVNSEGQTSVVSQASTPPILAVGAPAAVTDLNATPGDSQITLSFTLPASHASTISMVNYTETGGSGAVNGSWNSPGSSGQSVQEPITGLVNGTTYSVTVSACNESNKCGPDSNVVSGMDTDPYGKPQAPTVSATQNGDSIDYTWSGGGNNGRPITGYNVCIDGTCTPEGPGGGMTSVTYQCSSPADTINATVTDTENQTSASSTTASATPETCAPPTAPALNATPNGNNITWSWSGGGGSPLTMTWALCIDGACHAVGASPGSETDTYTCGTGHSATVTVTDSIGQAGTSNTASATVATCPPPPPTQTVTVSWGGKAPASDCQGDSSCTYLNISWSGFSSGSHTITPLEDGGSWNYPSTPRSGASGTLVNGYWIGYCGSSHTVTATVDGVASSNSINTEQHGC
jgi:hypothetical protein